MEQLIGNRCCEQRKIKTQDTEFQDAQATLEELIYVYFMLKALMQVFWRIYENNLWYVYKIVLTYFNKFSSIVV